MKASGTWVSVCVAVGLLAATGLGLNMETVTVGDPGNAGELSGSGAGGSGEDRICGAVGYTYNIGKYEVTAGQYCEFLNAVAKTDTYGLYRLDMTYSFGCQINRSGSPGNYMYSVAANYANRPVNYVSYWSACRFTNWLSNGQPTGAQGATTTERGTYALDGYNGADGRTIQRNPGSTWAVTSEDEWYKAAYYKGGSTNAGYWDYPTRSDTVPGRDLNDVPGNNANYYDGTGPWPIESLYWRTVVGEFQNSPSPYGTFDQGGNVYEWNESIATQGSWYASRDMRGGSWRDGDNCLLASWRFYTDYLPTAAFDSFGFRVVYIPEPATLLLLALGGVVVMRRRVRRIGVAVVPAGLVALLLSAGPARADVFSLPDGLTSLEMVTVGNPGNAGDTRYPSGGVSSFGGVAYTYNIGKYEVTAGQYCQFLNAVARTDTYLLYHPFMNLDTAPGYQGCNIKRGGSAGNYTYTVAPDWANRPVNFVHWADAARFCNWLTNGQPTGNQGLTTTEDGSYFINGANQNSDFLTMTRKANARYVLPTEDEWYKAAYYDPDKPGGAGYWLYATRSNTAPSNSLSPTGTNNVNYLSGAYTIDAPYYRTEVGAFAGSPGAYGTFDQNGNVSEWNEAIVQLSTTVRGLRGGAYLAQLTALKASTSGNSPYNYPFNQTGDIGFRIVEVPEPTTFLLVAFGGLAVMRRRG
jgi:formylglycine-generating enzyme required for sulfatase activity